VALFFQAFFDPKFLGFHHAMTTLNSPPHPGEVLREYLPMNMSATEVALRTGVSRQAFSKLLTTKPA